MRAILTLLLGLLLVCGAWADQLKPVDNTAEAPDFEAFRTKLLQAVRDHDAAFFRERSRGAKVSFGMETSLDEMYKLDDPQDEFWKILSRMIELGGYYEADHAMVYYPYLYAKFPENLDSYEYVVVTGEHVNLRAEPSLSAAVVGQASYDLLKVVEWSDPWVKVQRPDGSAAYVHKDLVYSPVGHRMGLKKKDGRWMITFLVAGD
ncbi:MAG: SH3 domain-containing protein [Candidatus Eremiobacteraeota bacterium]|nr:SH3 domain-containing protein [Candidatus Eremiobacteraeota bacterium]